MNINIYIYIYIFIYIYIYIYIRRPLQSVERVRLYLLAYNMQPSPSPNHQARPSRGHQSSQPR